MKLLVIGNNGGTNVGFSFHKSAQKLGHESILFNIKSAQTKNKWINSVFWRLLSKRFPLQANFNAKVIDKVKDFKPDIIITTGHNPLYKATLKKISSIAKSVVHFSTDDPWNNSQKANWFLRVLPSYNVIFTPRKSNINDFQKIGCKRVVYLPFAYDEEIFDAKIQVSNKEKEIDVLFVGGADEDRRKFFNGLKDHKIKFNLVGSYWEQYPELKEFSLGSKTPEEIISLTLNSKLNLCLVRKANRDGHVMRTFEMAAIGASMLIEDTNEHREIFGNEGDCVYYFNSVGLCAKKINDLLKNTNILENIRKKSKIRVLGVDTYVNRIKTILKEIN